jgi:hypothetical protein
MFSYKTVIGELNISSYQAKLKNIQRLVKSYTKDKTSLVDKLLELRKTEQDHA